MEILFQEGAVNINDLPFPKHHEMGKGQVMMAFHAEMEVNGDETPQPEGKSQTLTAWNVI